MPATIAPSANFRNAFGLLFRMLLSGKRAAYSALIHEALRLTAKPLNVVLRKPETRLLSESRSSDMPQVFVVGAPRSGTTLVYQTLARYLDVSYFSNLTSLFPDAPITGTRMFCRISGSASADFRNFYGQTSGLSGPNDGFSIWNQWLGEDRYVARTDQTPPEIVRMRAFFESWNNAFGKPLLNKNNRNTSCLEFLARALPHARFVVIRRNPLLVAQSLITARQQVQGDRNIGWGLHSQTQSTAPSAKADPLSYVDDVCDQICRIESELADQLDRMPPGRVVQLTYEGFCEQPGTALREISAAIPGIRLKEQLMNGELKPFEVSQRITLSADERERAVSRLSTIRRPVGQIR